MIDQLEIVHSAKRVHNDLKLSNIMMQEDESGDLYPVLIDFGYTTKFIDKNGNHIDQKPTVDNQFKGNLLFASKHQLDF